MRDITTDLAAAGGVIKRTALRSLGHTGKQIKSAVADGRLRAVGRLWVALPGADAAVVEALRWGGILGGASALRSYGVWVTAETPLQIATKPSRSLPAVTGCVRIWERFEPDAKPWRVSIVDALVQHARRVDRDDAIASIDSAWHQGLIVESDVDGLFRRLPQRCQSWRRLLDQAAGSGLESLLRVPCRDRGWTVASQVPAPGGGFSDLLIDGWLYIEADGDEWHDNERQAAKDRRRDRAITDQGDRWLRFGYAEVVHDRARTMATIELVMSQGRPGARRAIAG